MINSVSKFDGTDYVEWSRSFDDIMQISWPFLCKIVSGLEKPEPILRSTAEDPTGGRDNDDTAILMNMNPLILMILRLGVQLTNTYLAF